AIANTAAYHIPTVEQGGGSLRMALAHRTTSVEVLRLLISMAPIELMHFQTISKVVGNAPPLTDPTNGLRFPDLNRGGDPNRAQQETESGRCSSRFGSCRNPARSSARACRSVPWSARQTRRALPRELSSS